MKIMVPVTRELLGKLSLVLLSWAQRLKGENELVVASLLEEMSGGLDVLVNNWEGPVLEKLAHDGGLFPDEMVPVLMSNLMLSANPEKSFVVGWVEVNNKTNDHDLVMSMMKNAGNWGKENGESGVKLV